MVPMKLCCCGVIICDYIQSHMITSDQVELAPERQERIRALVRERGVVRVDELCRDLKISPATARRDLEQLEQDGRIRRVHGGAVNTDSRLDEPLFDDKTGLLAREKRAIAAAAAAVRAAITARSPFQLMRPGARARR